MIYDQLKDYCDCTEVKEADVDELVSLISMATGWQTNPCDSFLSGERREVIDLPSCSDCPITFEPYYHPFVPESFRFYLAKTEGVSETVTEITDFSLHADGKFYVDTGLPSCSCGCSTCGCEPEYKMIVEYIAGYEDLPECLLPVFCAVLELIKEKNKCGCPGDCPCEGEEEINNVAGDVLTANLFTDITELLVDQYKRQIATLSLYRSTNAIWGCVV